MLQIKDLVFDAWGRRFFDQATVSLPKDAKVGLVGRNGVGKSTLFKLILGQLVLGSGEIGLPRAAFEEYWQKKEEQDKNLIRLAQHLQSMFSFDQYGNTNILQWHKFFLPNKFLLKSTHIKHLPRKPRLNRRLRLVIRIR